MRVLITFNAPALHCFTNVLFLSIVLHIYCFTNGHGTSLVYLVKESIVIYNRLIT